MAFIFYSALHIAVLPLHQLKYHSRCKQTSKMKLENRVDERVATHKIWPLSPFQLDTAFVAPTNQVNPGGIWQCIAVLLDTPYVSYVCKVQSRDDFIKRIFFSRYWHFVRGIHRPPVNSPHKGQWRGALVFSLIWTSINRWVNNCEPGDLRRHRANYEVSVMVGAHVPATSLNMSCACLTQGPWNSLFTLHSKWILWSHSFILMT